jgi:hypothetical protein
MRKIAIISYKNPSHANSSSSLTNKRQKKDSCLQLNTHDDNKSPLSPTKKIVWYKSTSKDG